MGTWNHSPAYNHEAGLLWTLYSLFCKLSSLVVHPISSSLKILYSSVLARFLGEKSVTLSDLNNNVSPCINFFQVYLSLKIGVER